MKIRAVQKFAIGIVLLLSVGLLPAQVIDSVSFAPANPSTGQPVTAHLSGQSLCAGTVSRNGLVVTLQLLQPCSSTSDLNVDLGSFGAGTYSFTVEVCSDAVPQPPASSCTTTTVGSFVVVDPATAGAPILSPAGMGGFIALMIAFASVGIRRRRERL